MKSAKFAPITSALLARKGEARPWANSGPGNDQMPETMIGFFPHTTAALGQAVKDQANDVSPFRLPPTGAQRAQNGIRKVTLRLPQADYEKLCLIAAKRDITRQRLLQQMLGRLLAEAAEEYGTGCGCIGATFRQND